MENKKGDEALGQYCYDDDMTCYQEYSCGVCTCSKFIEDDSEEAYEYEDEIGRLTDWHNYINNGFVDLECHCDDYGYVLVKKVDEYGRNRLGWVNIEENYEDWEVCPNCGNKDDLERIISKDEDKMTMKCSKCNSENIFNIE